MNKNSSKISKALSILEHHYLNDKRKMCLAFSGGKDSTAILHLTCAMLLRLSKKSMPLNKKIYVINSNTLAELPPLLKYLHSTLKQIKRFAEINNLPIAVKEVSPDDKNALNVQLIGVGMPPPSSSFRWCTDKLKVNPINIEINNIFKGDGFISIIGTRKDESFSRAARIKKNTLKGTDLKINNRYKNSSNLMPIEDWNTKDVWSYLFMQDNNLVDVMFLWKLYSDASDKKASECSFVAAGGQNIDDGKLGCGVSRFGCWQCYMVRDNDKSLDGLMNSGHENMIFYKNYRDWYWRESQKGWSKTRDVYGHRLQEHGYYNKGGEDNPKYGMTMPRGMKLYFRTKVLRKILELQEQLSEQLITSDEILLIQERWLYEGDINLNAFKIARKNGIELKTNKELQLLARQSKKYYKKLVQSNSILKQEFATRTLQRFSVQTIKAPEKIDKKFFPSKEEEIFIRNEWKKQKKLDSKKQFVDIFDLI
ncbi:hypothetical protein [uncultured Gammaproteobacteria bacterium]|jgi:DNA sulfur modification protein DndC|nr:hypothetical protein [uncultured Gammaproteobacteria bacterium]CAC9957448.1 hypothetical protein [uncultured Gammaproteobacteria bacterium]CAC9967135.1 hypothetical protein [uncultured Gammaproteobacteria bacterium]